MRTALLTVGLMVTLVCAASNGGYTVPVVANLTDGVWMKGDLHVHSRHSRDSSNNPISKILALADHAGMDYLLISDHDNHVNGDVAHHTWTDPQFKSDSVLLLYGAEWTTVRGHGTAISVGPYDHQRLYDVRDQRDVAIGRVKNELGIHLSANHPSGKDHFGFSYDLVDSIEVWNSVLWPKNDAAILIWYDMLNSGRRLTGRGGSDSHHGTPDTPEQATPNSGQAAVNNVGTPTTWVYGTAHTAAAVVAALTNGRVSVSANPYAPRVELYADLDGDRRMDMMMGDNAASPAKPVTFRVQLVGKMSPDAVYTVNVVKNGEAFRSLQAAVQGNTAAAEFVDTPAASGRTYYLVQVAGPATPYPEVPGAAARGGTMVGLSNPLYFNFDPNF
ncbi:MAG TPA: CehA/McbA family metallohydrolase [Steroidobacteraceae bacterium]|nr:CehA/McbA family metallohydrolase [Steroidobacteraceae bacterium]